MAQPGEWTTERLAAVLSGPDSRLLRRMSMGVAILGSTDEPPGSCVLVVDDPRVRRLTDLPRERRLGFLADLDLLSEAVHNVCGRRAPGVRVALEIPGDGGLLHARVCPRYEQAPPQAWDIDVGAELDRIGAAARGDYPSRHHYGSRSTRPSV